MTNESVPPAPAGDPDLRAEIERSIASVRRFESERVMVKPDWSVWNTLSWIAFRDLLRLCDIQDDGALRQFVLYGDPAMKTSAPELLLIRALAAKELRAVRNGEQINKHYWFGKTKVDRDIWLERESVQALWSADPWSLPQTLIWIITRDPQQVEDARASGLDQSWAALCIQERPQVQVENAISELTRRCRDGEIGTFHGRVPISPNLWKNWPHDYDARHNGYGPLEIELLEGEPFIVPRFRADRDSLLIGFSPGDVMRYFRPYLDQLHRDDCAAGQPGASTDRPAGGSEPAPANVESSATERRSVPSNEGGRPTDREIVIAEAKRHILNKVPLPESAGAWARLLEKWLDKQPNVIRDKQGNVTKRNTIRGWLTDDSLGGRSLWEQYQAAL